MHPSATHTPPPVATLEWEKAGGPALSVSQRLALLGGAGVVVASHFAQRLWWLLSRWHVLPMRTPRPVDLARWSPPDSRAAREANELLHDVSSKPMINHSLRTYYFSGIMYDLSGSAESIDREALYVAALLHDVGLFEATPPATEHCFTVGGARTARRIVTDAGWDKTRQDSVALAIMSNLNTFVPIDVFGVEAHFMRAGGLVEVLAQEWMVHRDNVDEILARYPREGFAGDAVKHLRREVQRNPGCRFACLDPLFPLLLKCSSFSQEARLRS